MIVFLLFILLPCVVYIIYIQTLRANYWKKRNIPHQKPHFLFGNVKDLFLKKGDVKYFANIYNDFPEEKFFGAHAFFAPFIFLKDPDLIKSVMIKKFKYFADRIDIDSEFDALYQSIVNLSFEEWKLVRPNITPFFTSNRLKSIFPLILEQGNYLAQFINRKNVDSNFIDIIDAFTRYNIDLLGSVGFGISTDCLLGKDPLFKKYSLEIFDTNLLNIARVGMKTTFKKLGRILKIKSIPYMIETYFINTTKNAMNKRLKSGEKINDFIDLLLELKTKGEYLKSDSTIIKLDDNFMASQCLTLLAAGYHTTTTTMSLLLNELAHNQDIQEKLYQEIMDTLMKNDDQITLESLSDMPYTTMVIDETLRLYPAIPVITRECTTSFKSHETNLCVDKGVKVIIPIYALQRDPKYFPDPEKFIPERFMDNVKRNLHPMIYMPFGGGPRVCIGIKLAYIQIKIGIISIIRHYKVEPCLKSKYPVNMSAFLFFLECEDGIWLKLSKRQTS